MAAFIDRPGSGGNPLEYFQALSQLVPASDAVCKELNDEEKKICAEKISQVLLKVFANLSSFEGASPDLLPRICTLAEKAAKMKLLSDADIIATFAGLKGSSVTINMNNKTGPIAIINKPLVKGKLQIATGMSYEEKLEEKRKERKDLKPYSELKNNSEMRKQCLVDFEKSSGIFLTSYGDHGEIGVVTNTAPKGDKLEFQEYHLGMDVKTLESTLQNMCGGVKPRGVVGILYRREPHLVLVHKHDEPKEAWGYEQKFWSFSGGLMEGGVLNTTLGELYEESGFQLPNTMQLSRIRFDRESKMFYVYLEDTTSGAPGVEQRLKSPTPVNQFTGMSYKQDGAQYLHPRRRGDYDSTKVIWALFNPNAAEGEPFVRSTEIDGDTDLGKTGPQGRFDSFINRAVQADLKDCLG